MHFNAFRMWGGLSGEAYVGLMLAVIRRCGMVIADLSGLNANVVYEVGVARGLDKRVLLLTQRRSAPQVPANIDSDQLLLLYSPRERGWPEGTVLRCAAQASIMRLAQDNARQRVARSRRRPGEALPRLGRDDLERSLQRVRRNPRPA
jgi:nucleoside 2-deoxyribosyltransferase